MSTLVRNYLLSQATRYVKSQKAIQRKNSMLQNLKRRSPSFLRKRQRFQINDPSQRMNGYSLPVKVSSVKKNSFLTRRKKFLFLTIHLHSTGQNVQFPQKEAMSTFFYPYYRFLFHSGLTKTSLKHKTTITHTSNKLNKTIKISKDSKNRANSPCAS